MIAKIRTLSWEVSNRNEKYDRWSFFIQWKIWVAELIAAEENIKKLKDKMRKYLENNKKWRKKAWNNKAPEKTMGRV